MEAATTTTKVGPPKRRRRSAESDEKRLALRWVSPSLILMAVVAAYPIGYAIWLSLNEYSVRTPGLSRWARGRTRISVGGRRARWGWRRVVVSGGHVRS